MIKLALVSRERNLHLQIQGRFLVTYLFLSVPLPRPHQTMDLRLLFVTLPFSSTILAFVRPEATSAPPLPMMTRDSRLIAPTFPTSSSTSTPNKSERVRIKEIILLKTLFHYISFPKIPSHTDLPHHSLFPLSLSRLSSSRFIESEKMELLQQHDLLFLPPRIPRHG